MTATLPQKAVHFAFFNSCLLQAMALHQEWSSEKAQRIELTERLVKKETQLADQVMLNDANQNTIRYHCTLCLCLPVAGTQAVILQLCTVCMLLFTVPASSQVNMYKIPSNAFACVLDNALFSVVTASVNLSNHLPHTLSAAVGSCTHAQAIIWRQADFWGAA